MNGLQRQVELIRSRIATLVTASPPPYIYCSKINCLIRQLKDVATALKVKIDPNKKMTQVIKDNLVALQKNLDQFQLLHAQCCRDVCAQIVLTVSIRSINNEFETIRANCIKALEALGFESVAQLLVLNQAELESQDQVDVKRLALMLKQLQMKPELCKRPDVENHLKNRMKSLDALGMTFTEERESIALPELPSSLNLVVQRDDIELFEEIGRGQSGNVVRGLVKVTNEEVAVKIVMAQASSSFEMFRREVTTMATLKHPSLLKFCGYTTENPYYLLTEYMENGSLYDFLEKSPGKLTPTDRTLIALDIARGMEFLHGRGIIHRDLKSSNVLLDGRKRAKIGDFGLTRTKSSGPMTGMVGTQDWMAPEVLVSLPFYDEKVDVYSFGIVLWELLTSKRPYQDVESNPLELIVDITMKGTRPEIPGSCPKSLRTLIEACWHTDPKRRPSFHEIVAMLCDPLFQFPGCELMVLMQETGIQRHVYSSSSPAQLPRGRSVLRTMSEHRLKPTMDSLTRAIRRVSESMVLGHMEHFNNALEQLKYAGKASNIDFGAVMPQLTAVVTTSQYKYRPKLVQVLFEILREPKAVEFFDQTLIARMLRSESEMLVSVVQAQLSMNPNPSFFGRETIDALLSFASNPEQNVRVKSLLLLLAAIDGKPEYFVEHPELIPPVLSFSGRKLPWSRLESLLVTCVKLFRHLEKCPDSIITRLIKMQTTLPRKAKRLVSKCIEVLLKFPNCVPYYDEIWQNSLEDIDQCLCLFSHFIDQPPPNPSKMLAILVQASAACDPALDILAQFVQKNPQFQDLVAEFLPTNSENHSMLVSFYSEMLTVPKILQHQEFYAAAVDLLDSDKFEDLNKLLSSDCVNYELFDASQIPARVISLLNEDLWRIPMLRLMCTVESKHDTPAFRSFVPQLFIFMSDKDLAHNAFLTLAAMSRLDSSGFDFDQLLQYAVEVVSSDDEQAQSASVFLLRTFLPKCSNPSEILKRFLKFCTTPTSPVVEIANLFLQTSDLLDASDKQTLEALCSQ